MGAPLRVLICLVVSSLQFGCAHYGHVAVINESEHFLSAVRVTYPNGKWSFSFGNGTPRCLSGFSGDVAAPPPYADVTWIDQSDGKSYKHAVPVKKTLPKGFRLSQDELCFVILSNQSVSTAFWEGDRLPRKLRISTESPEQSKQRALDEQLMDALQSNDLPLAERCLADGANVNSHRMASSQTPISSAMGNVNALKLLFNHGAVVRWELPLATHNGVEDIIKLLVAHGADVNYVEPWSQSPLTSAVANGSVSTVRLLIEMGADVNKPIYNGITPLYTAVLKRWHEIARLLLEQGAKPDQSLEGHQWTALDLAKQHQDAGMVDLLTQALAGSGRKK